MLKVNYLFALMLLTSCAFIEKRMQGMDKEKPQEMKQPATPMAPKIEVEALNLVIKPGEVTLVKVPKTLPKEGKFSCNGKDIPHFEKNNHFVAFVSETYFSKLKPFTCHFEFEEQKVLIANFKVEDKKFPSERIYVDRKRVFLSKKNQKRAEEERAIRHKAYSNSPSRPLFFDAFELPIKSKVTSIYGSKRVFNKKKQTQHLGTDYRAPVGKIIKTANRGRVVLSRYFFYTGNTVIIDHGLGIFTTYGHLSKRLVTEDDIIPSGTIIGKAGSTGRSTGPHLHWGVTVNGLAIEGDSLIKASKEML